MDTRHRSIGFELRNETCLAYFDAVCPHVSRALISDVAFDAIRSVASKLPARYALSAFGFECRLTGEPFADIGLQLESSLGCGELLAMAPPLQEHLAWQVMRRFGDSWQQLGSWAQQAIDIAWLEFDVFGARPFVPSAFWRIKKGHQRTALEGLHAVCSGAAFSRRQLDVTCKLLTELGATWELTKVGSMLSREQPIIRLCLRAPTSDLHRAAVARVPGAVSAVERFLEFFDGVHLTLDILDTEGVRIGLEGALPRTGPDVASRWEQAMGYLVDYSLATSEKAAAVLDYPGHTSIYEQKDLWPASIRACWQDQPMAATSFLIRELSHVKLTIDANGHQEAKIYLTASHYWKDFLGMRDA